MKTQVALKEQKAFTLIELLVVIALLSDNHVAPRKVGPKGKL